jgi:hypothetical protein
MDLGLGWDHELPPLTQMEEMLLAPTHALVQLWQVCGGQTKYAGHACNFCCDNAVFHAQVPLLPEECDVIILCHSSFDKVANTEILKPGEPLRKM